MTSPAYQHILDLQDIDVEVLQLNHRFENHELRGQLSEANDAAATARSDLTAAEEALEENAASQRQIQHRVAELETKRESSQSKLYSGAVSAANELLALEEEVKGFQAKQDEHEGNLLELMEQSDSLESSVADLKSKVETAEGLVEQTESALEVALTDVTSQLEAKKSERDGQAAGADPVLFEQYEQLAPSFDGTPVARLTNGGCDGCHIQLSVVALDQIERLPDSAVVNCEECGRLLVH